MNEMSPPQAQEAYDELKAHIFERDSDLRNHRAHFASHERTSKLLVETIDSEIDDDLSYELFDVKKLSLTARYNAVRKEPLRDDTPLLFTLSLESTKQLDNLPPALQSKFSTTERLYYKQSGYGELSETHTLEYDVRDTLWGLRIIGKLAYTLNSQDAEIPLHSSSYPSSREKYERVAVASEQRTLLIPPTINEEQSTDIQEQLGVDAIFYIMQDAGALETTPLERAAEELVAIRSLLKTLRSSSLIPTVPQFISLMTQEFNRQLDNRDS